MPYVHRSASGQIESLHREPAEGATEYLASDAAEVMGFLERTPEEQHFHRLDIDFVRVIEDVVDTLIVKNVINITDLPREAQAKLMARKTFRERVTQASLRGLADTDFGEDGID
jgi:hypothetical protein